MRSRLGDQTVFGRDLVHRRGHERVVDQLEIDRDAALHAGDRDVEVVVGAEGGLPHDAALRGVRIDVVEMGEAGLVFHLAEQRESVPPLALVGLRRTRGGDERQGEQERP